MSHFKLEGKLLAKVARQGKVAPLITKGGLKSDGHNLSIGLKSGPVRPIKVLIAEVCAHFSTHAESRIDCAVTEITRSGEVVESRGVIGGADCDNLSVRLDQDRKNIVFEPEVIGHHRAAVAKGCVETSIGVISGQGKIRIGYIARVEIYEDGSGGNDLAVGLQGHVERVTTLRKSRRHDAAASKGPIERSVRVVADYFEIAQKGKKRKGAARDHDFAVRLDNHRRGDRGQAGEICSHFASPAEGGVERAIRIVAGDGKVFARVIIV